MRAFVTVGSTRFDALVNAALSESVLNALAARGYTSVVVQAGNSALSGAVLGAAASADATEWTLTLSGLQVEVWRFKPALDEELQRADLVISHGGGCRFMPP
jgi:beta-1,4-N-acetylglucosaminyltransferase